MTVRGSPEALGPGCLGTHSVWKASLHRGRFGDAVTRLPCWLSGREPACQRRRPRFRPQSRRVPRAAGQLSLWATTVEPAPWSPEATLLKPVCPAARAPPRQEPPREERVHRTQRKPRRPRAWHSHKERRAITDKCLNSATVRGSR